MKTYTRYLLFMFLAIVGKISLQAQTESSQPVVEDGQAFYIYRNDGDFNGFFYDEVEEMRYSKLDIDSVMHDECVVQEIVTADSIYRIPLCAIDSIGFVQPEIIVSDICSLLDDRSPYFTYEVDFDGEYSYNFHYLKDWMTRKVLEVGDIVQSYWYYKDEQGIRKSHGMFLARVRSIKPDGEFYKSLYGASAEGYYVECDPIESMDEIFKQFVTVEKEYSTPDGRQMRRMAGYSQVKRKLSDRRDLTLVDLNGHFYKEFKKVFEGISFTADIGVDINAKATGTVVYNISRGKYYIKTELSCEAAVGISANLTGTLNETYTQYFAKDVAFMFPSFLPIFQISPLPGTFVRSSGDVTLSLRSPKIGAKASFAVIISDDGISGSPVRFQGNADTIDPSQSGNDGLNFSASLNGSTQTGVVFPFMIETNSWLRRFLNCSVGAEVFVGPKFSGSFTLDAKSMLSGDVYGTFSNTQIGFTPLDVVVEGSCSARIGTGKDTKQELFKAEMEMGRMQLNLFPQFDTSTFAEGEMTSYTAKEQYAFFPESGSEIGMCISHHTKVKSFNLTIHPYGTAMPCKIYAGVYNKDKERLYTFGVPTHANYSLFNQPGEIELKGIKLPGNGEFHICPVVGFMGFDLPVWSEDNVVNYESPITVDQVSYVNSKDNYLAVGGIHQGDIVQIEYVPSAHDGNKFWLYGDGGGYALTNDYFSYSEMQTYGDAMGNTPLNTETDKPFVKLYKFSPRTSPDLLGNDIVRIDSSYRVTVIRGGRTLYTKTFNPTYFKNGSIYFYI